MPTSTEEEMLLIENKIKEWRKTNEVEKEEDTEKLSIDNPEVGRILCNNFVA